jgi:hypothetical protein
MYDIAIHLYCRQLNCRVTVRKLTVGDATRTAEARSRIRRISGTPNGFVLLRMFETASAICDLNALSSAADDSVGDPFCRFCRPEEMIRFSSWVEYESIVYSP